MLFSFQVSTPANTTLASPQRTQLPLDKGTIVQVDIGFPPGPQGLLHAVLLRGENQVWPTNPQGDFAFDHEVFSWPEEYELDGAPLHLDLITWNLDNAFAHIVLVQIDLQRPEEPAAVTGLLANIKAIASGLGIKNL